MKNKAKKKVATKNAKRAKVITTNTRNAIVMHKAEPTIFVPYDRALSMLKPDDTVNVLIAGKASTLPRAQVVDALYKGARRSGKNSRASGFGLAYFNGAEWVLVETLPQAPVNHSIHADCNGKYCVTCGDDATHKIYNLLNIINPTSKTKRELEKPMEAFLCCHHFAVLFGEKAHQSCYPTKPTPTPEEVPAA